METIATRKIRSDVKTSYQKTLNTMQKGQEVVLQLLFCAMNDHILLKEVFEELFNETIPETIYNLFNKKFRCFDVIKQKDILHEIACSYCQMGNIMGFSGTVFTVLNEVEVQ